MTTRSSFSFRSSVALAFALALGGATSAHAVPSPSEPIHDVTIYRQLGYAFGFTNATPTGLFGAFGGGGGGGGGGGFAVGTMPQLNLGNGGGNFLMASGGGGSGASGGGGASGGANGGSGGFEGMISPPSPVLLQGASVVEGGGQGSGIPSPNADLVVNVPDLGISTLGFGLTLALFALAARRQSNARRVASVMQSK